VPSANPARGSAVLDRDQQSHGFYKIISGLQDGQGAAAVFAGSRRLFVATAHTVPDAVEDAKTSIAMRLRTFQAERRPGMASAGELRRTNSRCACGGIRGSSGRSIAGSDARSFQRWASNLAHLATAYRATVCRYPHSREWIAKA
jgi:hypothetical protein